MGDLGEKQIRTLNIDLETFSPVDLAKCGVYRYAESPDFRILLFGYSVNDGPVVVEDLSGGGTPSMELLKALVDPTVEKRAFNASFERVCLSRLLRDIRWLDKGEFLSPVNWRCTMVR